VPAEGRIVVIRGGGDLGSACALRLSRCGLRVLVVEVSAPLAVRRSVALSEAIHDGVKQVEELTGVQIADATGAIGAWSLGLVPVLVDPEAKCLAAIPPSVLVDATMTKRSRRTLRHLAPGTVGLGPGFVAGVDVDAVVETNRGPDLGRVLWSGTAEPNTHRPAPVEGYTSERVLRAPTAGILETAAIIGTIVQPGQQVASVGGSIIVAPFQGLLRGLLRDGVAVAAGQKIGDVDPRLDPDLCRKVSDKALAVSGGVLEAVSTILHRQRESDSGPRHGSRGA